MRRSHFLAFTAACFASLLLAGCGAEPQGPAPAGAPAPVAQAPSTDASALSVEELRARASAQLNTNQLHSPAGDNAVESYLALRAKSATPQADVETALADLAPYVVIAAEQATTTRQWDEAERLIALLSRVDESAPALTRLGAALQEGRSAAEATRVADEERAAAAEALAEQAEREASAEAAAPATPLAAPGVPPATTAPVAAAPQMPQPAGNAASSPSQPAASRPASSRPTASGAQAPAEGLAPPPAPAAPTASRELISQVAPRFPQDAIRRRLEGEVEVLARVAANGNVEGVEVLRSNPPRVFDREAVLAVRRWRYAPAAEASSVRVVVSFKRP